MAAASLLIYFVATALLTGFSTLGGDFAYMEAVLARQLAESGSFAVFPDQLTHGVASLLWEVWLYPFAKLSSQVLLVSMHVSSILFASGSVLLLTNWLVKRKFSASAVLLITGVFALSPPVVFAAVSGGSTAMGLFFAMLYVGLLVANDTNDSMLATFYVALAGAAAILARPEAAFLVATTWLLPTEENSLSLRNLLLSSLGALAIAAMMRKVALGSVSDGVLGSIVGARGILGAISLHRMDTIEILRSILLFAPAAVLVVWASFATLLIPASAALIAVVYGKPNLRKRAFVLLILPAALFGAVCAEIGSGEGFRYAAVFLPGLVFVAAAGLEILFSSKPATNPKRITTIGVAALGLLAILMFGAGTILGSIDFGDYWNTIVYNVWRQALILDAALFMTAAISVVLFSGKTSLNRAYTAVAILLSLALVYPVALQVKRQVQHIHDTAELIEKMEILVHPTDKVAFAYSGVGLWYRPKNSGDITGRVYEHTSISNVENPRDRKESSLSQLRRAMAWGATYIMCNPKTECIGAKENSEFQFVMKQGKAILLKTGSIKSNLLKKYGPSGTSPEDWIPRTEQ